jgi:hypothetical protein
MLARVRSHVTYANVVATIALFAALGGGAYAAVRLPANSVGTKQLKKGAVTPAKVARSTIARFRGEKGARGDRGDTGAQGPKGDPGARGDIGPKGDTGARGADGTARAWAYVTPGGTIDPLRSKGFSAIGHTGGTGLYCLTPAAGTGIDTSTAVAVVTPEFDDSAGARLFAYWAKNACGEGKIGVWTANEDGGPGTMFVTSEEGFSIAVP